MKPIFDPITFVFSANSNHWQESLFEVIRQNIAGWCQQPLCFQTFDDDAQQCFALTPQAIFPAHTLNVKVMGLNPGYLLKSFLL